MAQREEDALVGLEEVARRTGLAPSTLRAAPAKGGFPRPEAKGPHGEALWHSSTIDAVVAARRRARSSADSRFKEMLAEYQAMREAGRPFSSLPDETQRALRTALGNLRRGKTSKAKAAAMARAGLTVDVGSLAGQDPVNRLSRFFLELDWWIARHGSARVPQTAVSSARSERYPLGLRVSYLRQRYNAGRLDPSVVSECEARAGWRWRERPAASPSRKRNLARQS